MRTDGRHEEANSRV